MTVTRISFAALLLSLMSVSLQVQAQTGGCDAKRVQLEKEIAYAKDQGNANRVRGLETALENMKANCTDAKLRTSKQRKIDAAQKKVDERRRDLDEAKAEGKSEKKIAERQRKLDAAHADLDKAYVDAAR